MRSAIYLLGLTVASAALAGAVPESADAAPRRTVKKAQAKPSRAAAAVSPRWGFYDDLAGSTWLGDNGVLYTYKWAKPGEILSVEILAPEDSYRNVITLGDDGTTLALETRRGASSLERLADGSFIQPNGAGERVRYRLDNGAFSLSEEKLVDGVWQESGVSSLRKRVPDSQIEVEKRILAAKREAVEQRIALNWGPMRNLIGQRYLYTSDQYPQYNAISEFEWLTRGSDALLSTRLVSNDKLSGWVRFRQNPQTGKTSIESHDGKKGVFDVTPEGRLRLSWDETPSTRKYGIVTHDYYLSGGTMKIDSYFLKKGKKKMPSVTTYAAVTGQSTESVRVALAERQRKIEAQRRAEAQAKAQKKGGGMLGGLMGAIGGAAAGAAFGGNTETILGAAAKGAALVDPGSASAAALNMAGDSLIGGTATSGGTGLASIAGGSALGGKAGGSYPTRPNALNGSSACSMMNEGNYRTVALEGGNDVQLKTMCGQAFEYYTMYKRAIAQGYSEADANRTYAAHQGAAQNAISFYNNNRAN